MDIEEAIAHVKRGDAVLFTGAGFSSGAKNMLPPPDDDVPDARQFAGRLAKKVGASGSYDLPIISQYYIRKEGEHGLVNAMLSTFSITNVRSSHKFVASLPWRRVYTTNYDNCFEFAALQGGKEWTPVTLDSVPNSTARRCVHINGHINSLTPKTLSRQIKLTHSSYSAEAFSESQWPQQFRQDLNAAKAVIYIGYSLSDIDISRMLFSSPELKRKTLFVVGPHDDDITITPLEDYGDVHRIGLDKFAEIAETVEVTADIAKHDYTWLIPYGVPEPKKPTDKDAIELLTMGMAENEHIAWAMGEPGNSYCTLRETANLIMREIERDRRWFLIHSDLGNGKSILKQQLSYLFSQRDYKVFWDSDFDLNRQSDLSHLNKEEGRVAVFIDESPDRFDVIDGLLSINNPHITVFVCVRSTLYELGEARYEKYLPQDYIPVDINYLTDSDVDHFVRLLNQLGLWGSRARKSDIDNANFIKVDCRRGIARLIVSIFEESEIGRRITKAATQVVNGKTDLAAMTILSFLLNRIGHPPNPGLLSDILDRDAWQLVKTDEFRGAGEFIRFKDGLIKSRSSIISTYLLRKTLAPENLVWHIERFVRRLAKINRNATLHHVFVELQRFPVLESIIESPRKREIIIGYFQSIKDIPWNEKRPLFWLHYAMARLAYGEFKESSLYFEHARALAEGNPKDMIEVNNHYARLLLDSRIKSTEYVDYFEAFEMAHGILLDQMNRGTNKHFPYRQAKTYVDFISFRKQDLTETQVKRFAVACRQVVSAVDHLQGTISRSKEVDECKTAMERAIKIASTDETQLPAS